MGSKKARYGNPCPVAISCPLVIGMQIPLFSSAALLILLPAAAWAWVIGVYFRRFPPFRRLLHGFVAVCPCDFRHLLPLYLLLNAYMEQ